MIIIKLSGGLGNQFFQYAIGRQLSIDNNTELRLDKSGFSEDKLRSYGLGEFEIYGSVIEVKELLEIREKNKSIFGIFNRKNNIKYIKQKHVEFNPRINKQKGNLYLDGYWQSEKYFKNIKNILRKELSLKNEFKIPRSNIKTCIENKNSISIHIRRGDYVTDPKTRQCHGVCSESYYKKAIDYIVKKINDPHFFIFSDDMEWVKDNFKNEYPTTYIDNANNKDYQEIELLSLCKHHIISNSTFSWWGAWLSENSNKIVVTPNKWFNDLQYNTRDIIPQEWEKISV